MRKTVSSDAQIFFYSLSNWIKNTHMRGFVLQVCGLLSNSYAIHMQQAFTL
jgi:hypothetical protein